MKIIVKGKIQGVGYRQFIQLHAQKLCLEGSIQNKENGDVIIFACGLSDKLDDFIDFVYQGSKESIISDVIIEPLQVAKDFRGIFRIIGFNK